MMVKMNKAGIHPEDYYVTISEGKCIGKLFKYGGTGMVNQL